MVVWYPFLPVLAVPIPPVSAARTREVRGSRVCEKVEDDVDEEDDVDAEALCDISSVSSTWIPIFIFLVLNNGNRCMPWEASSPAESPSLPLADVAVAVVPVLPSSSSSSSSSSSPFSVREFCCGSELHSTGRQWWWCGWSRRGCPCCCSITIIIPMIILKLCCFPFLFYWWLLSCFH